MFAHLRDPTGVISEALVSRWGEVALRGQQPYAGILGGEEHLHIICITDYIVYFTKRLQRKSTWSYSLHRQVT